MESDFLFGGVVFDERVFKYCLVSFKDAFSRSSVSIENAFREFNATVSKIDSIRDRYASEVYLSLDDEERKRVLDTVHMMMCYLANKYGVFTYDVSNMSLQEVNDLYEKYFGEDSVGKSLKFNEDLPFALKFDGNKKFDSVATFQTISVLFPLEFERRDGKAKAEAMQKDNLDAFDYSRTIDKNLNIDEITNINSLVVNSDPNKEIGFKKFNNRIVGAEFETCDKTLVPSRMSELLYNYENNFGDGELLDFNEAGLTLEEKERRVMKYFVREAKFHIEFERIHPFTDGNGRTGRIIMNHNLMRNDLVPVIFTEFDSTRYKKYINKRNYQGMADLMMSSSSQLFSTWVSIQRTGIRPQKKALEVSNKSLSRVDDVASIEAKKLIK